MTHKDYGPIAGILRQAQTKPESGQREYIIYALADLFQNDNQNFKRDKFLFACNTEHDD